MPRRAKGARLYLRARRGREPVWVIRDGADEISTHCGEASRRDAERALQVHLAQKFEPDIAERDPRKIPVASVLTAYARVHAPRQASPETVAQSLGPLLSFWGERPLSDVRAKTCEEYVAWRISQPRKVHVRQGHRRRSPPRPQPLVSAQTARRELECLQAAIGRWHKESPLAAVPQVTLPEKSEPRQRVLSRQEAASMLRAARRLKLPHIARFVLIGIYTGTRHRAILSLRWMRSLDAGSIDLEQGLIRRRGEAERETKKRRATARIPDRLLAHLRRWHGLDHARGIPWVVHWRGGPILKERRAFASAAAEAGLGPEVTPHVLKHTCATWALRGGLSFWDVAQLLGTSAATIERTYAHASPDFQFAVSGAFSGAGRRQRAVG